MLPTEDVIWVGEELQRRFGLPYWQLYLIVADAIRFADGVESIIREQGLTWIVKRLGCSIEYWFREKPPRNGAEAFAAI